MLPLEVGGVTEIRGAVWQVDILCSVDHVTCSR